VSTPASGCVRVVVGRSVSTTVGRVGRLVSQGVAESPRQLPTTSGSAALCRRERVYVPVESLGRWTIGAEDSKALLCRRQWIAVESKDRCFVGKLKFCRIV